jgi:SAM-dependent methyltransferase
VPLQDYEPIAQAAIADASVDLVTCYVGLHHMTAERLTPFLASVARILRPGGVFIVRDHDVDSRRHARAGLARPHRVQRRPRRNLGDEPRRAALLRARRHLGPAPARAGFDDRGHRLLQDNDPTRNALFCFEKRGAATSSSAASRDPAVSA